MAQGGELLRGNTFARPWDFYTILPLREAKRRRGCAAASWVDRVLRKFQSASDRCTYTSSKIWREARKCPLKRSLCSF
jgi:hypothetical protein